MHVRPAGSAAVTFPEEVLMSKNIVPPLFFAAIMSIVFSCGEGISEKPEVSTGEIRSVIEFLSQDHLEGRAPGTRGGEIAEEYMKSIFGILGIGPYRGEYFQEFELAGFRIDSLSAEIGGLRLARGEDIVGTCVRGSGDFGISGEVVFAGFGITCATWGWDDYGDTSVKDKILIVRVNEPGRDDPDLFEDFDLTYYGRWTYKIEEAERRGAKAIILIHTDDSAGYGWHVVQNSWGGEEIYLPSTLDNNLDFRGWIREAKLREILEARNISLDELYTESEKRGFRPVKLGLFGEISGSASSRNFKTRNVVGYIEGSDESLKDKAIVLSAHIDHLGMNTSLKGDSVFNGAIDNGSAVAAMVATAKACQEMGGALRYPVIVLACQAEEAGLLGSRYFAESLDPSRGLVNINFESTPVWGRSRDFFGVGAKYSDIEDIMKKVLRRRGLEYSYFSMTDAGFFYRNDQFSFARRGMPSVWVSAGEDFESGVNHIREFFLGDYHTVDDEFDPEWELESAKQTVEATLDIIDYINEHDPAISFKGRMAFPVEER